MSLTNKEELIQEYVGLRESIRSIKSAIRDEEDYLDTIIFVDDDSDQRYANGETVNKCDIDDSTTIIKELNVERTRLLKEIKRIKDIINNR